MRVALVQMGSGADKAANLAMAKMLVGQAIRGQARFILLPEVFNVRVDGGDVLARAETIPGPSLLPFMKIARKNSVWILAGSITEKGADGKVYNTSVLIDNEGRIGAVYRKIHLFDVAVAGTDISESKQFQSGNDPVLADVDGLGLGMSVCYDLRFPELYRGYSKAGAQILSVPSSFTSVTGELHWEVLLRARAVENQCFVLAPNQIGVGAGGIASFGHSMVVSPWGQVLAKGSAHEEEIVLSDLDFEGLEQLRKEFPVLAHRKI